MHPDLNRPRLAMRGVEKSFGAAQVLRSVDLELGAGEVLALLGANGAGKSTLMKILVGAYSRDAGSIEVDGAPLSIPNPMSAIAAGIRLLPQEISVFPEMTVAENVFIGDLPANRSWGLRRLDAESMRTRSSHLLAGLGLHLDPNQRVKELGASAKRIVEIARALVGDAKVLVMDEPTAALTEHEVELLFRIIRQLTRAGVGVIYISHHLDEVFEIADRIQVLRDGRTAGVFRREEATRDAILRAMLGDAVADLFPPSSERVGNPVLEVESLSAPRRLENVSFAVGQGEIVGVFGLVGSGIETLGKILFGAADHPWTARIRLNSEEYHPETPSDSIRRGIGFVAAERATQGVLPDMTVQENLTVPYVTAFAGALGVNSADESAHADHWINRLKIRTSSSQQRVRYLSGGNQQKVCLARWFFKTMQLIILEEPTRGVDVGARRDLYRELRRCASEGTAILIISSDVEEVAGLSDRTIVLDRGRVVASCGRGETPARLMSLAAEAAGIQ